MVSMYVQNELGLNMAMDKPLMAVTPELMLRQGTKWGAATGSGQGLLKDSFERRRQEARLSTTRSRAQV